MRSQVVGSIVCLDHERQDSIGIAPADHEPARAGLAPLRATAPVPDDHMEVPDHLLRLGDGDTPSPKLVQGDLRSEQLIDDIGHRKAERAQPPPG